MGRQRGMGGGADRAWMRRRDDLLVLVLAAELLLLVVAVCVPLAWLVGIIFDLEAVEATGWGLATATTLAVGRIAGTVRTRSTARPFVEWSQGASNDLVAARHAALVLPHHVSHVTFPVACGLSFVVCMPYLHHVAELRADELIAAVVATMVVCGGAMFLSEAMLVGALRPALVELSREASAAPLPESTRGSLERRLLIVIWLGVVNTGLAVPAMTTLVDGRAQRWVVSVSASLAVATLFLGPLFRLAVRSWVTDPLRDLGRAAQRIGRGELSEPVAATSLDELGELAVAMNQMQRGLREREALHRAFEAYVDPALAQRVIDTGSSTFPGEEVDVTILFADVRDFTSYSERATATDVVSMLNELFEIAVPLLHAHGGHVNRYLGDGMLAVFGAPLAVPDHADAATAAAMAIQQGVQRRFGSSIALGMGLNSGPVIAGTVGGAGHLEFTVIGDAVNTAARVEQLTKETKDAILLTEATLQRLSSVPAGLSARGAFAIRGKAVPVSLFGIEPAGPSRSA